jgi:hypothetical protein
MDGCGGIFLFAGVGFAIYVIYIIINGMKEENETTESHRNKGDAFRVSRLNPHNKSKGWIDFKENEIEYMGWSFVGLGWSSNKYSIGYGELTDVQTKESGNPFVNEDIINIQCNKFGKPETLSLKANQAGDTSLIKAALSKHVEDYNRKVEIEKLMRVRYRAGNFDGISPNDFERVIQELFTGMGYSVLKTGHSGDEGIDLICKNYATSEKVIVQCKRYSGNVGSHAVRDFFGALIHSKANRGYIVTTSDFTKDAKTWAKGKPIELIDRKKLSDLMMRYYR